MPLMFSRCPGTTQNVTVVKNSFEKIDAKFRLWTQKGCTVMKNMGKMFGRIAWMGVVSFFGISAVHAAVTPTEVVTLPSDDAYGGGDRVGSQLVAATYNAGKGPGIWIVADGGYRLYHNGALLAEDNQAGRVRFIPMTFLPGENAISVVGVNGAGAPGVMVQIDELDKSYYSGSGWKSKPSVSDNKWKNKGRDLSQWGSATTLSYASDKMPSGGALNGFAANTQAKWIWTSAEADPTAVLLFTFYVKAEGFGASTTGGDAGKIVIASDTATIRKHMQSNDAVTILVPEGTYDFRKFVDADGLGASLPVATLSIPTTPFTVSALRRTAVPALANRPRWCLRVKSRVGATGLRPRATRASWVWAVAQICAVFRGQTVPTKVPRTTFIATWPFTM